MKEKHDLNDKRVAVLATHGFEQSELMDPVDALQRKGAAVDIITPDGEGVRGWLENDWGQLIAADQGLAEAAASDYDALLLPGGVLNSDKLRTLPQARQFVRHFFENDKPVFVICHGAQILIDCKLVEGRKMTSYQAIASDLLNAGADWRDSEVVIDDNLITSRSPDDLPAFCSAICSALDLEEVA